MEYVNDPVLVIVSVLILAVYLIPFIIATCRGRVDNIAILVINFFFGWSVIGWVVTFVWALLPMKKTARA